MMMIFDARENVIPMLTIILSGSANRGFMRGIPVLRFPGNVVKTSVRHSSLCQTLSKDVGTHVKYSIAKSTVIPIQNSPFQNPHTT